MLRGGVGIAEILAEQPGCRDLVVPYAAIDLAAARILELGESGVPPADVR